MIDIKEIKQKTQNFSALCVDDEEKSKNELEGLLKMFFKKVYVAKDGKEALEEYYKNQDNIDIIFTDINMPKMDGVELTQKIKDTNPLQYITVISAQQDLDIYTECINCGVNGIIVKPITSEKIIESLFKSITFLEYIHKIKVNPISCKEHYDLTEANVELFIDRITGLYNKAKLDRFLLSNIEYNLVLVNLDNFDHINCKYGYKIGDQVLKEVAKVFLSLAQDDKDCFVFRVVSDEFVFLIKDSDIQSVEHLCKDILKHLDKTKIITDLDDFNISCTIGISSGKGQDILRQAHIAVKESREIGKEKYYFFSNNSEVIQKRENNLKWLKKIKKILKDDSVIPYYQPIMNNKTGKIEKQESLARILEINRIVKPYYFLENAKLFNLIPNITKLMIVKVFKYISKHKKYDFAINITEDDLCDETFVYYILKMVDKYEIDPSKIILEFVETVTISEDEIVFENLKALKDNGFKLAIDDFGINHLNIQNLHSIKIDYIKIYNAFIENIDEDKKSKKVVESIVKLAHTIGAKTIAESVSSKEIQKKVKQLGIDYSQGYYIGKPNETI